MNTTCRVGTILAIGLLLTTISAATGAAQYSGGTGEPNDPYQIATAADLIALGEDPNDYGKHFILIADIDLDSNLPGRKVFDRAVIAPDVNDMDDYYQGSVFTGSFDGNRHVIRNPHIKGGAFLGLFGQASPEARLSNLGLGSVDVNGTGQWVGGLVGVNYGSIMDCYSSGTTISSGDAGGLVGSNWGGSITNCCSTGSVSGGYAVGGLIGANSGTVIDSYSACMVTGERAVGGLVGSNGASHSGSLGIFDYGGSITNCYSAGSVNGHEQVGGLVGSNSGDGSITASFWDTLTSGQPNMCGTQEGQGTGCDNSCGKTTTELRTASPFLAAGWDFVGETANGPNDVWKIVEGLTYPFLSWQKYSGSTGEPNDPYQIATAADLIALGGTPEDYGKHFILIADIDLDPNLPGRRVFDRAVIAPDVNDDTDGYYQGPAFTGVFDGDGHVISHLTITGGGYLGLFGWLSSSSGAIFGGEVKNLGLANVDITGSGDAIGALVGSYWRLFTDYYGPDYGTITNCYSTGTVHGTSYIGGLVGQNVGGSIVASYSSGSVSGTSKVGGLVGSNGGIYIVTYWGTITNSYSTASVSGTSEVGGLVGENCSSITFSFWDTQTSGQTWSGGGTGKTTAEMQTAKTFLDAGWDFVGETKNGTEDIWWINEGRDYPRLRWEPRN